MGSLDVTTFGPTPAADSVEWYSALLDLFDGRSFRPDRRADRTVITPSDDARPQASMSIPPCSHSWWEHRSLCSNVA